MNIHKKLWKNKDNKKNWRLKKFSIKKINNFKLYLHKEHIKKK